METIPGKMMNEILHRQYRKIRAKLSRLRDSNDIRTIAVCASQVPFCRGGAEAHVDALVSNLRERNFEVDLINLPYKWYPRDQLLKSIKIWEMIDLSESNGKPVDMIITTKFPSYYARHSRKVLWLIHQFRQIYDLFETPFSGFNPTDKRDLKFRRRLVEMDNNVLKTYPRIYTNSANTALRLKKYNGIKAESLYHPPMLADQYSASNYGDYILSVGRLDKLKRVDLMLKALKYCSPQIRGKIAGTGPEKEALELEARSLGISDRIEFLGFVSDEELVRLYAECGLVFFAPQDEDYGYITLEAFLSGKPVITGFDSGGPLEFVKDGETGLVLDSFDPQEMGRRVEALFLDKPECRRMGAAGRERVQNFNWDLVIDTLLYGGDS